MTEQELLSWLLHSFPRENEACEWKEFKQLKHSISGKKGEDLISYISSIANMQGGTIVVGVKDFLHEIVGIQDFHDYTIENISLRVLNLCANLNSEGLTVTEYEAQDTGKRIWLIHVPKHKPRLPVYAHGKAWQRVGDSLVEMRPERLATIIHESLQNIDWSAEVVPEASLTDLDSDAIAVAKEKFAEKHRNAPFAGEIAGWDSKSFLDKAKITINGKITRAALLLLGKAESTHFLPTIAQMTWKLVGEESAYEHFSPPIFADNYTGFASHP